MEELRHISVTKAMKIMGVGRPKVLMWMASGRLASWDGRTSLKAIMEMDTDSTPDLLKLNKNRLLTAAELQKLYRE